MGAHRLPDLGPRGEGWVLLQLVLFGFVAISGFVAGPEWSGWPRIASVAAGLVAIALGGFLTLRGILDLRENLTPFPRPLENAHLIESGAYRLVRHPIYGGGIVAAAGWGLATASPLALFGSFVLGVFFDLKSRREEIWLSESFEDYPAYRSRTRRLLPWIY